MLFVIHVLDQEGKSSIRQEHYPAHTSHLSNAANYNVKVIVSGPLVNDDDGVTPIGSLFVFEAENKKIVEDYHKDDPFYKAGLWGETTTRSFIRRR